MEHESKVKQEADGDAASAGESLSMTQAALAAAAFKQEHPSSLGAGPASSRVKPEADDEGAAQGQLSAPDMGGDGSRSSSTGSEEILPDASTASRAHLRGAGGGSSRSMARVDVDAQAEAESEAEPQSEPQAEPDPLELDEAEPEPVRERPTRLRRTVTARQPALGALSEDSYDDYSSSEEEEMRKTIMIGSAYQAVVPEGFAKYGPGDTRPYKHADKLLWEPPRGPGGPDNDTLEQYLASTQQLADSAAEGIDVLPMGTHTRDDEQALFLLMQCNHNVDEALRKRRSNPPPAPSPSTPWTDEECRLFENGILTFGKDFHTIQAQKLRTRTVSEIVQFYYLWKKTERHDVFANKMRPDKKKYMLHPGVTLVVYELLDKENQKEASARDTVTA